MPLPSVKVKKSDPPESTEILASAIIKISEGMDKLINNPGGLKEETLIILLQDATKVGKGNIRNILRALPRLRGWYCKK